MLASINYARGTLTLLVVLLALFSPTAVQNLLF